MQNRAAQPKWPQNDRYVSVSRPSRMSPQPPIAATRRAVIKSSPHRWQSRLRPSRQAAKPYVYASATLCVNARFCRRQGHPGSPGAGTFIRSCMPHGVGHPGGETDRQSLCRGRAARILARTIRMPPVSSIWIPGRRWAPAVGHPTVRNPVGGHARERHGGAGRRGPDHQGAGGYGCPGASILYLGITLSEERGEGERAHCRRYVRLRFVHCCAGLTDRTTHYACMGGDGKDHRSRCG